MKGRHKRAGGGGVGGGATKISGNPKVFEEAAKRKRGGRAPKPAMKDVGFMSGGAVKERLDRPGRKRGGAVGANNAPLSTAHASGSDHGGPKTQQGGMD